MTTFAHGGPSAARHSRPARPRADVPRDAAPGCATAMADKGVDALVLLGNGNVVYATGASWPLLDAGLSHVERPVAVVLADDEHPHLFMPFREGAAFESELPADHLHGPLYLEFDEGVEHFAQVLADLVPPGATVAVDELTGAMRRARRPAVPGGPAVGRRAGGRRRPSWSRRPTRSRASARRAASPSRRWPTCRSRSRPACGRSTCRQRSCAERSSSAPPPTCSSRSGR